MIDRFAQTQCPVSSSQAGVPEAAKTLRHSLSISDD
jgi:hypothetical protein